MRIPVKAKVYYVKDGATALKAYANVSIGDVLFINSYTVTNTDENPNTLRAFPPSYKSSGGKYKPYIEFMDGEKNPLSAAIYKACRSAYQHYEDTGRLHEYGETFGYEPDCFITEGQRNSINSHSSAKSEETINYEDIPF